MRKHRSRYCVLGTLAWLHAGTISIGCYEGVDANRGGGWEAGGGGAQGGLVEEGGSADEGGDGAGADDGTGADDGATEGGDTDGTPEACEPSPGQVGLHRLTALEYDASLRDLLGITSTPSALLPKQGSGDYDNNANALAGTTPELIEKFVELSEDIAEEAFTLARSRLVLCDPASDGVENCARTVVTALAERAFRRPVSTEEIDELVTLSVTVPEFDDGLKLAVRAIISSPSFLYRAIAHPEPEDVVHRLTDFELATRLSYFLWGTSPDDQLLGLAREGRLQASGELRAQVARMLADKRAAVLLSNVLAHWYDLDEIAIHTASPEVFPMFTPELRADMEAETRTFLRDLIESDSTPLALLNADHSFVNERLAAHYGIPGVSGPELRMVSLAGAHRKGLLTHASVLTMNSDAERTSIVRRGVWVLERLLCTHPPPPPDDIPAEPRPPNFGGTRRELTELHRSDPKCAGCHNIIDPVGFGLEDYDAIGRHRTTENGQPIDSSGQLPDGQTFTGALELVSLLSSSPQAAECIADHWLSYAIGSAIGDHGKCNPTIIAEQGLAPDKSLEDFVVAVVTSNAFLTYGGQP